MPIQLFQPLKAKAASSRGLRTTSPTSRKNSEDVAAAGPHQNSNLAATTRSPQLVAVDHQASSSPATTTGGSQSPTGAQGTARPAPSRPGDLNCQSDQW